MTVLLPDYTASHSFIHEPVDVVISSQLQIIKSFKNASASCRSSVYIIYKTIQSN